MIDFSIITPSYNYGHFLEECLASVAAQEGVAIEHLVMDGGSSDQSADVVAKHPHAQFFQEPDRGMSDAINKGFRRAQGNWVMWLNADDRLKPGVLKDLKEFLTTAQADVVYGGWDYIDKAGAKLRSQAASCCCSLSSLPGSSGRHSRPVPRHGRRRRKPRASSTGSR